MVSQYDKSNKKVSGVTFLKFYGFWGSIRLNKICSALSSWCREGRESRKGRVFIEFEFMSLCIYVVTPVPI